LVLVNQKESWRFIS